MKEHQQQPDHWKSISLAFQLWFLVIAPVLGGVLLGMWGDQLLQSSPVLLVAGFLVGLIVSIREIYDVLLPFLRRDKR